MAETMTKTGTSRIFGAPHRYYQGPGALDRLGEALRPFGAEPLLVVDRLVLEMLGDRIETICDGAGLSPAVRAFDGEITYAAVDALVASLDGATPGIVAGIGGGKALDAAKAVSETLGVPVATVPTIASNDSPTSAAIAMYDENHVMVAVDRLSRSPEAVIVDTALIAAAPERFLQAGIGDAVSKKFEAEGCFAGTGITLFGTRPLRTGVAIADCCYATLRAHAAVALADCARNEATPALEATVEAIVLMSGLGFENGGLSLAHSLTRGLVKARGTRDAIHGRQVAWGTLVQVVFEDRPAAEVADLTGFFAETGLPVSLAELGMPDPTAAEIDEIADLTMTAPHIPNLPRRASAGEIAEAIRRVEEMADKRALA